MFLAFGVVVATAVAATATAGVAASAWAQQVYSTFDLCLRIARRSVLKIEALSGIIN